ncbi:glycosyltransferase [Deferrisoma palaeochoriense]
MNWLDVVGVVAFSSGLVSLGWVSRFRGYVEGWFGRPDQRVADESLPPVTLILPCKGVDPGFEQNVEALLSQNYPDYEVIFTLATRDDPAWAALERLAGTRTWGPPIRFVEAGVSDRRAQKLTNLLAAVEAARPETQVFAFVDSDIRPRAEFLRHLVEPLADPAVGATTGIRWYQPPRFTAGSALRTLWAAGAYPMLVNTRTNFAWGGANAIRRSVFERGGVRRRMDRAVSDTFAITESVKSLGLEVRYVPPCTVVSHEGSTLAETWEWTNRQTVISRVYSPAFWWAVFLTYSLNVACGVAGLGAAVGAVWHGAPGLGLTAALLLSPWILQSAGVAQALPAIARLVPDVWPSIRKARWRLIGWAPVAGLLILANSLYSLTTRRIVWRGVAYELLSREDTRVLGG